MAVEPLMGHTQWYVCQVTLNSTSFKPYYALACILAGGYSGEPFSPIIEGRAKNTDASFLQLGDWQIWESKTSYGETENHSIQSQGLHPSDVFQGRVLSARGKDEMNTSHRSKNTRWLSHGVWAQVLFFFFFFLPCSPFVGISGVSKKIFQNPIVREDSVLALLLFKFPSEKRGVLLFQMTSASLTFELITVAICV